MGSYLHRYSTMFLFPPPPTYLFLVHDSFKNGTFFPTSSYKNGKVAMSYDFGLFLHLIWKKIKVYNID